jgi:hypothetical protein
MAVRKLIRSLWLSLIGAWLAVHLGTAFAQGEPHVAEYQVKAAFVCKFAGYVEWPPRVFERPESPLEIGVLGSDSVVEEMTRAAANQSIDGRSIVVRRLARGSEAATGVHIVFIARTHTHLLADALAASKGQSVLTVTEADPAAALQTGMINFVVVANKVRFDVAPQLAELSNLKISARLLSVARRVAAKSS